MAKIVQRKKIYNLFEYDNESEFEKDIIEYSKDIFGNNALYLDVKRRISEQRVITIPDGYLIDFSFIHDPRLYIVENELVIHDPYKHIGQQLLKFLVSYKGAGREIKAFLLRKISEDRKKVKTLNEYLKKSGHRNIDDFIEDIIFNKPVGIIVMIDEITDDLSNVLNQFAHKIDILEFKKYTNQKNPKEIIYQFIPFQQDIRIPAERTDIEKLDTLVVPGNEEGFKRVFLGENCWYAIRISSSMIDRIKYIAGYQTAPISAITHVAEVKKIERHKDTNKYIVYFRNKARKIKPIKLVPKSRVKAPQAPRYTNYKQLKKAKNLNEAF